MYTNESEYYAEPIGEEKTKVLKKIIENADLDYLFLILTSAFGTTIVDIDYERGRAISLYAGLKDLQKHLIELCEVKQITLHDLSLTDDEIELYHDLLREYGIQY